MSLNAHTRTEAHERAKERELFQLKGDEEIEQINAIKSLIKNKL